MNMAIDPTEFDLTPEQRQRLAILAEESGKNVGEVVDELLDAAPATMGAKPSGWSEAGSNALQDKSLYDVLLERGILGCFDGPTDLSTNPKHMEGFGESR